MIIWQRPTTDTFSEFTYGFALVNELVSNTPILSVPVFPSLLAEGRAGGGYDVFLDRPGHPLFLQFKLARNIRGWRAREFQQGIFQRPFYRMYVRPKGSSQQHKLLLDLERQNRGTVFYCAPAFHALGQLNTFYNARRIARYSRFVRPSALPRIRDNDEHWLSFQRAKSGTTAFFSEEGRRIELDERSIQERLQEALAKTEQMPFKQTITALAQWLDEQVTQLEWIWQDEIDDDPERTRDLETAKQFPREITPLEKVTILSQTILNSTFCVLQSRETKG
jgi:hypothetical protein